MVQGTIEARPQEAMMKKIQFDTINGVYEVADFDDDVDMCGAFSDHHASPEFLTWFREDFEGTRAMEIGDKVFAFVKKEYGIKEL